MVDPKPEKLQFATKLAYGAGDFGPAITANILVFYLLFFFTNVVGLPAALAGSILMIGKISDAINDPIVGMLSDRSRSRWGRRLPWMLLGAIPFALFFFLQWLIPNFNSDIAINRWWQFGYYVLIGILFNIAYTIVNLPYTALTPELTQDYNERTSLNSFRFAFSIGGSILSLALAGLIFNSYPDQPSRQFLTLGVSCGVLSIFSTSWCALRIQERGSQPLLTLSQKKYLGLFLVTISILSLLWGMFQTISAADIQFVPIFVGLLSVICLSFGLTLLSASPETHLTDAQAVEHKQQAENSTQLSFAEQLKIAFSNRAFLYVIGIYLCSWLAVQLTASILIYFVVSWMGLSANTFPLVAIAVQGTALVLLFFWKQVSDRLGKKAVYFMGTAIWLIAQLGLFLLQPGQTNWMFFLAILAGFGVSVAYLVPWSMVPDVIELDELRTGKRREGIFYAFMVLLQKIGLALALFLIGIVLEAAGFAEQIPGQPMPPQPESALMAIRLAIGPLPALALIIGIILAYFYPITREVHAQIRLQLSEREQSSH